MITEFKIFEEEIVSDTYKKEVELKRTAEKFWDAIFNLAKNVLPESFGLVGNWPTHKFIRLALKHTITHQENDVYWIDTMLVDWKEINWDPDKKYLRISFIWRVLAGTFIEDAQFVGSLENYLISLIEPLEIGEAKPGKVVPHSYTLPEEDVKSIIPKININDYNLWKDSSKFGI